MASRSVQLFKYIKADGKWEYGMLRRCAAWIGIVVVLIVVFVAGGATLHAQNETGIQPAKMMAKDADPDWDVVTVKPSAPNDKLDGFDVHGHRVIVGGETVESMLRIAYGVQKSQIIGGPDWVRTDRFDVDGVPNVEGQPDVEQMRGMVAKLLKERFGIVTHNEKRKLSIYAIKVGPNGAKMAKSTGDPDGFPSESDNEARNGGEMAFTFKNTSMSDLALDLLFLTDRPVVDQTGLGGRYDFKLEWTFDESRAPTDGTAPPSLFTAVQEQLGLKLDAVRAMTSVVVIDKVDRPSAN